MNAEDRCFCELAPLYILGLLDEQEYRWVEEQIASSPDLAAELAELQSTVAAISYSAPVTPVAPDLKNRLFERLEQEPNDSPTNVIPIDFTARSRSDAEPRKRFRPALKVGGAIAAVSLAALLVDNIRLRQETQEKQALIETLQQPETLSYALQGTENAADASGRLVIDPNQKAAVILVQNLPELPTGQAYRLWAVPAGATKPAYCGQFNTQAIGTATRWSISESACGSKGSQILITAESSTAPPVPAGLLVMKGVVN